MQVIKEEIRQRILAAAWEEFLKCGFEKASIRTIAANAKTAKSNVYNYFEDKGGLFAAVLEPTVSDIRQGLALARAENEGRGAETYTVASQARYMTAVMQFVTQHPAEIGLLLFHAAGSPLQGFREEVIGQFTDVLAEWLNAAVPGRAPSRLFIKCVAGFYVTTVEQMLLERPTRERAQEYMGEFLRFVYGGWSAVMKPND